MVTFRCTQRLLARMADQVDPSGCDGSTTALGDWYCNLIYYGRTQIIMCTSERSDLMVLLPAAPAKLFVGRLVVRLTALLKHMDVPQVQIDVRQAYLRPPAGPAPVSLRHEDSLCGRTRLSTAV